MNKETKEDFKRIFESVLEDLQYELYTYGEVEVNDKLFEIIEE